jgi:hypothetical protein
MLEIRGVTALALGLCERELRVASTQNPHPPCRETSVVGASRV